MSPSSFRQSGMGFNRQLHENVFLASRRRSQPIWGGTVLKAEGEGEGEGWGRRRSLSGKRVQRLLRSGVSQIGGFLVERDHVALSLTVVDQIGQAHHRVGVVQLRPLFKELHGLVDAGLLAAPVTET